ncbi:MAG: Lrp/AsnC family transcriptional regulator [Candidatus Aenigmatarchaeota archaeon]
MKLSEVDKKLLTYLYHHYREPLTKIAKACNISRDQVEYRMEKYEREGLIRKYLTIFNYNILGFNDFLIVWLKIKNNKEKIIKELEGMKSVLSVGEAIPDYDLYVNFICKDKNDFDSVFSNFLKICEEDISKYEIMIITYAEFFPLKIFGSSREEKSYPVVKKIEKMSLSEKDYLILKKLEQNGRARIIYIAKETKMSAELALYKIRQLHKKQVILGTRIQFDMAKLGFYFASIKLNLKNITEETKNKIISFCKEHHYINALAFGISEYNCLIQLFYQTDEELRRTIKEIRNKFKDEIQKDSLLLIENEGRARTLPY